MESDFSRLSSTQDPNAPASLLSLLRPEGSWGIPPEANKESGGPDGPMDLETLQAHVLVDPTLGNKIMAEAEAYPEFFNAKPSREFEVDFGFWAYFSWRP